MITLKTIKSVEELSCTISVNNLTNTIHQWMQPYADSIPDCKQGVLDALQSRPAPGGFILTASDFQQLTGVLVMLRTGMHGYIPPNIILFLAVDPLQRRRGIGSLLVKNAINQVQGPIKLHVERNNPARFLYENLGFKSSYLDMRFEHTESQHE